jgi:hypothetical protein
MYRVDVTARRVFQERWLKDNGIGNEIALAVESLRNLVPGLSELVGRAVYSSCYYGAFGAALPVAAVASLVRDVTRDPDYRSPSFAAPPRRTYVTKVGRRYVRRESARIDLSESCKRISFADWPRTSEATQFDFIRVRCSWRATARTSASGQPTCAAYCSLSDPNQGHDVGKIRGSGSV